MQSKRSLIEIHSATILLAFVGPFVKLIDLPSLDIVFGRSVFELITVIAIALILKINLKITKAKDLSFILLLGLIQAAQWYTFFESVKRSNVAIALVTLFTFPFFTAIAEPLFFREKFSLKNLISSAVIIVGIAFVSPDLKLTNTTNQAILWGLSSAVLVSAIFLISRRFVAIYHSVSLSFYKSLIAIIALIPLCSLSPLITLNANWLYLLLLGAVFTAIPYLLITHSLKELKASSVSTILSLEPIYGVIIALILLREVPQVNTIIGGVLVFGAVIWQSLGRG